VANFANNYGGNTPVEVYSKVSQTLNVTPYSWFGFEFGTNFNYSRTQNLLVEVVWNGDSDGHVYNYWAPTSANRCVYNTNGGTPVANKFVHYMRITIAPSNPAVAPTSLGRVKALFD
jgi:hypothetical protein